MLVFAFVVLFLPLAVGVTRAALLQVSPRVEEAARALGRSPLAVLRTVTAPLIASGVLAGGALVFLTAIKELPATLILAPIGFETLATEIWTATSVGFFERGALPSLVLLAGLGRAAVPAHDARVTQHRGGRPSPCSFVSTISCTGLSKSFGDVRAVDGLDLEAARARSSRCSATGMTIARGLQLRRGSGSASPRARGAAWNRADHRIRAA